MTNLMFDEDYIYTLSYKFCGDEQVETITKYNPHLLQKVLLVRRGLFDKNLFNRLEKIKNALGYFS